ncbi:hypothetical protein SAMN05216299_12119 [Nitrosospira sp. Nsp14]|nr:hypothetical protein SAMN05216299_12119 [Nitrosospira sp. Nsp14]
MPPIRGENGIGDGTPPFADNQTLTAAMLDRLPHHFHIV